MIPEGQFRVNGVTFGAGTAIRVNAFDPGPRVVLDEDQPLPGRDGRTIGRDFDDGPEWTFELTLKAGSSDGNFDALEELRAAWSARRATTELAELRYALPGRVRRVYGRPRRFAIASRGVRAGWHHNRLPVLATFQLADPLVYDDVERSLELGLVASGGSGVVLPAVLPWELGRAAGQRQGVVEVGGRAPAPFSVTFQGPTSGFASSLWAQGPGWRVDLDTQLPFGQSVTVDTRTCTVTRSDGVSLAGAARGRFLTARLSPGLQELSWGAADPSNTARAVFAWHDAYYSI